jgi:hypothetical protein
LGGHVHMLERHGSNLEIKGTKLHLHYTMAKARQKPFAASIFVIMKKSGLNRDQLVINNV